MGYLTDIDINFYNLLKGDKMSYKAVIFDLDGTLLDTLKDLAESTNRVLTTLGFPLHPLSAYNTFVGNGLEVLIQRSLPEEKRTDEVIRLAMEHFRDDYGKNWNVNTIPYIGVEEMLDDLTTLGISLNILSNKPNEFTQLCVGKLLNKWKFHHILGVRKNVPKKPSPIAVHQIIDMLHLQPSEVLFIGDSSVDMQTASNAGIDSVGVLWGFRSEAELRDNGATFIISHPRELLSIIR